MPTASTISVGPIQRRHLRRIPGVDATLHRSAQTVVAAPLVAPVGRPCARCAAVVGAQLTRGLVGRSRHHRPGWLWRLLRPGGMPGAEARGRS